ncbi:DNA primase large subunit-like isoform X2 [Eriocheir sinensis]|nr:DNA primase large subunit-like isoform X2 [Eriocheir sinensis]XP_050732972.1 DNA primase large subunit-like isoform X2 [Eriocheir sinensis]XP_050732973.1 DNA primase large subunit-like isoform X2 [Eriocheir sinensis]XP_050732974.1 DNA primase large subunit-like isoform X2 [Eriocheir sinensis]
MAFYIMPLQGDSQLHTLMDDTRTRLMYLCELWQRWGDAEKIQRLFPDNPELAYRSDSLIEGTKRDTESYFILKLAALSDRKLEAFITEAEANFFEHRLKCGGPLTIKTAIAETVSHLATALKTWRMTGDQRKSMTQINKILKNLMVNGMVECSGREQCWHSIEVYFTFVLPLVRTREVVLRLGMAEVECHQVVILLRCLFEELSALVDKQLVSSKAVEAAHEDERLSQVMTRLQLLFRRTWLGGTPRPSRSLKHQEVEAQSKYFPLCMKNLFRKLHQTNRLRHPERFRLTLFLKDIGLPLEENIAFWEKYYSKCSAGACEHTWGAREKRYIYSIRHIYGLEGARYNRPSHSCSTLQSIQPSLQDMGGCPFSGCDIKEMLPQLVPLLGHNKNILEVIGKEIRTNRPMAACQTLMAYTKYTTGSKRSLSEPCDIEDIMDAMPKCLTMKPLQYYMETRNIKESLEHTL